MEVIFSLLIFTFVIIWAFRVENGLNKLNQTAERIEKQLANKKEKK